MQKKDVQKLLAAYEERYPDDLTTEQYLEEYTYREHRPEADLDAQIVSACDNLHFHSAGRLGIYKAFQAADMVLLNDALYQCACEEHLYLVVSTGTDHAHCCAYGNVLYAVMAANLWDRVELLLPQSLGMSKNDYRSAVVTANLFLALWYKDPTVIEQSRLEAIAKLDTKMTQYERSSILYLLSLLDDKPDDASQHLIDLCEGVKRLDKLTADKFEKAFCIEAHGLFNLAVHLGIEGVEMPNTTNFSKELAAWQVENGSRPGKLFFDYPAPLKLINTVLVVTPPEIKLYHPYPDDPTSLKNRRDIDTDTFRDEVIDSVLRRLGFDPDAWFTHQMPDWLSYSDEEIDYVNKYHCNRLSHIRLHKNDFTGTTLPRRLFKFGTSDLMAAETLDPATGKYVWAVVARKKVHQNNVSYHSLYYSAYYESLEALAQGSTTLYQGMKKIAASMRGCEYSENGNSYCFEIGRMNVEESVREASTGYLSHRKFFGERKFADRFPERTKVTEILAVSQELICLCKEWHMDIVTRTAILELIDDNTKLYKFCEDNEIMFEGSTREILRVLDNGTERVMLDFYLIDSKRAHLKSAQTRADTMF